MKVWKYRFLEKVLLGQNVNIKDANEVIDKCINLSYRDMLTAGRYYIKSGNTICERFKKILEKHNYQFSHQLITDTVNLFGDIEIIGNGNKYVTRFGLSQKLVNMTFKYFYIFYDYINKPIAFIRCDCPLDRVILNKLKLNVVWSKCNKNQYIQCQQKIRNEISLINIDEELKQLGNLSYDFLNW